MKYLMTYTPKEKIPPTPEQIAEIERFAAEAEKAGVLLMTGGLQRPNHGARVRLTGGAFTVTDGPFAETKELIDGFALIEAKTDDDAIEHAKRFMRIVGDGECEVLKVFDGGSPPG